MGDVGNVGFVGKVGPLAIGGRWLLRDSRATHFMVYQLYGV